MTELSRRELMRSIDALDGWIKRNGWSGFDPHDVRGTAPFIFLLQPLRSVPLKILRRLALTPLSAFETSFPGFSRRLFGVKPTVNAKGMALFARAYLNLYVVTGEEHYKATALECLEWLERNRAPGYDEPCWGYPFDWQSGVVTPANTPASVVTRAVADAFWTAYEVLGEPRYLRTCEGICRFFLKHLNRDEMPDGTICFSYTPIDDFHVHNANLMVAEILVRIGRETGNDEWRQIGARAGRYALVEQNPDGSLYYWGKVQDYQCPSCIDHYHSGFEIRALHALGDLTGNDEFRSAARRYYEFYLRNLIAPAGELAMPKMTPRSVFPVNVHSCAEALMVNAQMARDFPAATLLLDRLSRWIIANMQKPDGSFAYSLRRRLGRVVRLEFPYLRWGQAWMLLGLSQYLLLTGDERAPT